MALLLTGLLLGILGVRSRKQKPTFPQGQAELVGKSGVPQCTPAEGRGLGPPILQYN